MGGDGVDAHLGSTSQAVTGANDAPVLDAAKTPALVTEYNLGTTAPSGIVGTPIGVLVDLATPTGQLDNVQDADAGEAEASAALGIAVSGATTTNGSWFYSIDNGTNWLALGAVSDTNARLLAVDGNTRIYFQPNTGFGGTATITFHAWDQATGTNGSLANVTTDLTNNGVASTFSSATDTADVAVNAPITLRGFSTQKTNGVASTTFTVAMPTGTVQGDVMIASISSTGTTLPTTVPTGWTLVRQVSGSGVGLFIYRKTAGASEAGPYSWVFGATQSMAGGIETFFNVDNASPVDVDASNTGSPSSTITAPSVTPTVSPSMLLTYHSYASSNNWTPPAGMTEAIDVFSEAAAGSAGVAIEGNYQALSSTAATGTRSATAAGNNNDNSAAESLVLKPATVLAIPTNTAPVLDSSKSPSLVAVTEDAAAPSGAGLGTLVSALVDPTNPSGGTDNVSDPDAGALTGIAITAVDSNCSWFYTQDNGATAWVAFPAVTGTSALLLKADATTRIYCWPNANVSGAFPTAVTFRAWDQTTGTAGTSANPGAGGGTSAYSSATDTASLTITAVNDAPVLDASKTPALQNVAEDAGAPTGAVGTLVSNLVDFASPPGQVDNVTDADTNAQLGIAITAVDTANLTAYYSLDGGTTWSPMGAVTSASARLLAADSDNRIYVNAGTNVNGTFASAITFRAWDVTAGTDGALADTSTNGGATAFSTATDVAGVVVSPVNDTPTATNLNAPETFTEDTPLDLTNIVVSDDDPTVTATLTLSNTAAGTLSTAGTATFTSGVWTITDTIANVNTALAAIVFTPAANFDQSFTIAVDVTDGTLSTTGTKAITALPVNDAPTLDASKSPALNAIFEDSGAPTGAVGTPVSALVDFATPPGQVDNVTDPDSGAVLGIAITATDTANLTAYYSINGGSTWQSLAGVTPGSARLLTAAASNRIYVNAGTNVNGTFANAITFRAWDVSAGANDTLADTTTNGGTTAFSTATDTASVTVTAVNDAPTATNLGAPETYTEDMALNLTDIVVSDIDSANVTVTLTLSNIAAGSLAASPSTSGSATSTFSNGVWTASGPIANVNILLAAVTFTPATNFNSNFNILTSVTDGVASAIVGSKPMTGNAVNDAPSATNLSAAENYVEDTALNLVDIVVSDPDSANVTVTLTLSNAAAGSLNTGTSGSVTSTYNAGTGVWTASGAIADINTLLAALTFTPAANSTVSFDISTSVTDNVASPVTGIKPFSGTPVNDPPTATNMSVNETYVEGSNKDLVDIVVSDVDNLSVTATLTLSNPAAGSLTTGSAGASTSTYNSTTGVWTVTGLIFNVNTLLSTVQYVPATNFNSTFTIATSVSDGPNTITGSKTMNGVAVNTPPSATNLSAAETYTEDTNKDLVDIVVSDADSASVTVTLTLSNTAAGALSEATSGGTSSTFTAATGVWTASGPIAEVNALLAGVQFQPAADFNASFTIATSVTDGLSAAVTGTKNMTGVPVNDAPTATNLSVAEVYTEDTPVNLTDIVVADVDGGNLTATLTLSTPAAGSFNTATSGSLTSTFNAGTGVWTASGAIADVNTLLAGLTFTPAANFNSSFTVATSVTDTVAPALTGTKAFTGTAVNDPPVAVDDTATVPEGAQIAIDVSGNDTDVDDGIDAASVTLGTQPTHGTITAGANGSVSYHHDGTDTTSDSFTYTIKDASGQVSNSATVTITITPVADDADGDGVPDDTDNCKDVANATQIDTDMDGMGDKCDPTPGGVDTGCGCSGSSNPAGILPLLGVLGLVIGRRRRRR